MGLHWGFSEKTAFILGSNKKYVNFKFHNLRVRPHSEWSPTMRYAVHVHPVTSKLKTRPTKSTDSHVNLIINRYYAIKKEIYFKEG